MKSFSLWPSLDIQSVNFFFGFDILFVHRQVYLTSFAFIVLDAVRLACVHFAKIVRAALHGKGLFWEENRPKLTQMIQINFFLDVGDVFGYT